MWVVRSGMGDRYDINLAVAVSIGGRNHNGTGPGFPAFLGTGAVLVMPEIGIGNDQTRRRFGNRHDACLLAHGVAVPLGV